MINKTINKQPKSVVEIDIIVPWADLGNKWNEVISKISREQELPGFRKGQAPLEMVEQKFGQEIQQEFLKQVLPQSLMEALQNSQIVPIDYPQYQIVSFTKGSDLNFKARVTSRPQVQVGNYKALKAPKPQLKTISDEDVNKVINDLFNRWKSRQSISPSNSLGNTLSFNQAPTQTVVADSPNDDFAKAVGAKDLVDLKTKIKQDLEEESKVNSELDYEEAILQEVAKITTVDLPDILVEDELNRMLVSLQRRVADMGLLLDDYLKNQKPAKTVEGLKAEWRVQAEKNVRMELGLSEVARLENVIISDQDLQAEIDKVQDNKLKVQFEQQEPRMHLRHALRQTKTLNLLKTLVG